MGSKINRICELSAEVGKATLIMADKDNRINEMGEYTEKLQEENLQLERTSAHVIEQNEKLLAVLTDLEEKLQDKNAVIDRLKELQDKMRKDGASLRKLVRQMQADIDKLEAVKEHAKKKPIAKALKPKLVEKKGAE